jgi:hypothetical protein
VASSKGTFTDLMSPNGINAARTKSSVTNGVRFPSN